MKKIINITLLIDIVAIVLFMITTSCTFFFAPETLSYKILSTANNIILGMLIISILICILAIIINKGLGKIKLEEYRDYNTYDSYCLFEKKENKKETFFGRLTKTETFHFISHIVLLVIFVACVVCLITMRIIKFENERIPMEIAAHVMLAMFYINIGICIRKAIIIKRNKKENKELSI